MTQTLRDRINALPLPKEYVDRILRNAEAYGRDLEQDAGDADDHDILAFAFKWSQSPELRPFWLNVYKHLDDPSNPLPPLPSTEPSELEQLRKERDELVKALEAIEDNHGYDEVWRDIARDALASVKGGGK